MLNSATLFEPWLQFKTPAVRQLAFCIASPNIVTMHPPELSIHFNFEWHNDNFWENCYQNYQRRLIELDQNPTALHTFLAKIKSTRLGIRFESLLWFWLQDNPNEQYHPYRLIQHSVQQIQGKQTLGELDFLLLNTHTMHIEHWEVALKFYLAERQYQLGAWYGLNRQDTLQKKLQHFTQKQFQFSRALGFAIEKKYAVLKGQLYLPTLQQCPTPTWVNQKRRLGTWGNRIPTDPMLHLSRHEWLCPDAEPQVEPTIWWRSDLYYTSKHNEFFMFRQPSLLLNHSKKIKI
ncbi:DUF1853 family protein [Acinetobacter sp. MD2]|uniref:DUF1853 family protein n=1 Tax=Acinetobacter sp. MD2 TaxID=2600066 RepID=UPI002D1E823D|nr:DUF1853 family protein [Acinetobacter sp. MD2]MEB3767479.1 DUF1853 family protein [Acinetobacter sp. MD2]